MKIFIVIAFSALLMGCSLLMPYDSDFSCARQGVGVCGDLSDVYNYSIHKSMYSSTRRYQP